MKYNINELIQNLKAMIREQYEKGYPEYLLDYDLEKLIREFSNELKEKIQDLELEVAMLKYIDEDNETVIEAVKNISSSFQNIENDQLNIIYPCTSTMNCLSNSNGFIVPHAFSEPISVIYSL